MAEQEAIPEHVLDALEEVRADGDYNMTESNNVIRDMLQRADGGEWPVGMEEVEYRQAVSWLIENPLRYMEAVIANGQRRSPAQEPAP